MKKIVIYTLITFIFSVFASSCEDNKDNSLYYPDFTWDTGRWRGRRRPRD